MLKGFVVEIPDMLLVGAEDKDTGYKGPVAEVSYNDDWLWIITDQHEGAAMLNIEALPALRCALARLAKTRRAVSAMAKGAGQ